MNATPNGVPAASPEEMARELSLYRAIFDEIPDVVLLKDHNGDFLLANRTLARLYNTTPEAMVGKHDGDFGVPKEMAAFFRANVLAIMARGETEVVFEDSRDAVTGEIRHFKSIKRPFKDAEGRNRILVIAHDITDVIRAQARIAESERRLQEVMAATQEGIWDWELETGRVIHNRQWYRILGFSEGELADDVAAFSRCLHPEDGPAVWERLEALLSGRAQNYYSEHRMIRKDGSVIWVRDRGRVTERDARGRPLRVVGTYSDISERKYAEQRLLESEARFRATFDQAAVGIAHVGVDGSWRLVNDKLCAILGYDREALLGRTFQDITHAPDLDADLALAARLLAGTIPNYSIEKRYVRQDGSLVWTNLTSSLIRDADGEPAYFIAVVEDIQRRKETEAALEAARAEHRILLENQVAQRTRALESANRELQAFTYAASHDLKAPLGRISNFSTLLAKNFRDRLEGDGLLFLDFISSNALRMTALVDDMLEHARMEQQGTHLQAVSLRGLVGSILQERQSDLAERRVGVRAELPEVMVWADPLMFGQVMRNLIDNAIKYSARSQRPQIEIGGEVERESCRLWVGDNGVGFDMAYHDRIFEIFRRLHTYDEFPGSGVGLALVKKAMDRMGGRVWAESAPGLGATFFLRLRVGR